MEKDRIQSIAKVIPSVFITAALCSILYTYFLTVPFIPVVGGIREATVIGILAFFLLGMLARIWTRKFYLISIGAAIGIIAGGGWVQSQSHPSFGMVQKTISIIGEAIYRLTYMLSLVLTLFVSTVIAWTITNLIVKKYITSASRKNP